ncbi:MAG: NAD(P)/FAD-dependent oxidoreductase [Deltaproteobacteria bacterium]|nr:NAD(P)/FAD-dependent oxidoreductase [Deltaproteobacteria bacterium]
MSATRIFPDSQKTQKTGDFPIVIVGSGFSGLCMGILLRKAGIESFTILEKADEVGGTWRDNTYPGAACDVQSYLYSYSFEPRTDWSRAFSPQPEILDYLRHCARKYDLYRHIRFGSEVEKGVFDERTGTWTVHVRNAAPVKARALVMGTGALHIPAYPSFKGMDRFEGRTFHSARWDHGYDLAGKTVAVIGTGASAIQFVPEIQPKVKKLHLFQRTAPWVLPKPDRRMKDWEHTLFRSVPAAQWLHRAGLYWTLESRVLGFAVDPRLLMMAEKLGIRYLNKVVKDPELRRKLTPDYHMGCKRILMSNDYYQSLCQPNAEVVTEAIDCITPRGIRTKDGTERPVDAILFGTGFSVTESLAPVPLQGLGGQDFNDAWRKSPGAYYGITRSGFPNLYIMMGPNTGLGHNSMVFMIEAQARYAVQCIGKLRSRRLAWMDVRQDVESAQFWSIQKKLRKSVWASGCKSWYQAEDGTNPTLWPGFTFDYWLQTRRVKLGDYVLRKEEDALPLAAPVPATA